MKATLLFVACLLGIVSPIAAAVSVEQDAYHVTIRSFDGVLVIRPLSDSAMRVRYSVREVGGEKSEILLDDLPAVRFSVVDTAQSVIVRTARMSASFDKAGGNISFFDASGSPLASEKPKARFVRASTLDGESCLSVGTSFSLSAGETLYGTGQFQDGQLVINDLPRHLLQENTQIAVPFVLSSKGYGILWHNTGATEFNMEGCRQTFSKVKKTGKTRRVEQWLDTGPIREDRPVTEYTCIFKAPADGRYGILLESGTPLSYEARLSLDGREIAARGQSLFVDLKAGKHTFVASATGAAPSLYIRSRDSQFSLASPVADALDYVVFAGPDPDDVVAAYRLVTGAAPMLPEWAYGFIQCRERYQTQQELLDSLAGFRSRGLPLDGIVQDWQYWGKYGWNAMQFDEANYPDPAGMVKAVHENNAHIMISVWSNLAPTSDIGQEFTGNGFFIPGTNWIDFFNPEAADAYWQHIDKTFNSIGFDAWWLDATEPERDQLHGRTVFTGQGDRVRNIYPLMVSRSVYTGQRASSPEKRVFILTRSAFSGQQRYASCVWSGDINANWDVFRRQIPAGQNYVATGMPYWTTDAGGFFRPEDQYKSGDYAELFIRWLQFATFTPLQRVHGSGSTTEPWNYGKLVE
ncbi:MAG TPA: glycoside hydrolase family 31 protein, partial [Opitutales bacterium]|nr:glycoside hydrolase family 31 protein [Opitutales bacterium]